MQKQKKFVVESCSNWTVKAPGGRFLLVVRWKGYKRPDWRDARMINVGMFQTAKLENGLQYNPVVVHWGQVGLRKQPCVGQKGPMNWAMHTLTVPCSICNSEEVCNCK